MLANTTENKMNMVTAKMLVIILYVLFQVIVFLKKKEGFIGLVLKHIDASAMMDLLLRLISCVEPAPLRQEVLHVGC